MSAQSPPYGQPDYPPQGHHGSGQDHPKSTTVLVLGIVSLVVCQILGPFAWVMGNRVLREIDSSSGRIGGRSTANAGRICGIVASVLLILSLVVLVVALVVLVAAGTQNTTS